MIGLDMLKRHRCCINLAENVLEVGDYARVPFLPESELPHFAKLSMDAQQGASSSHESVSCNVLCLANFNDLLIRCLHDFLRTCCFPPN